MNSKARKLELLAPARDAETAIAAIDHGADAVYIGAAHHGARAAAGNSPDDIRKVTEYAHRFDARVYVTVNTLIYDDETGAVEKLVGELYRMGVDALIVQDLGLLRMNLPPIALHASTQCDISTPAKARFLEQAGFSQLVLARECTLDEIRAIRAVTDVPLESFVHGALCVSYSGNCQASFALTGRSANRGECAQICRLAYDLIDGNGATVAAGKHLLSLRDMNRIASLGEMIEAGVSSFKIEGRLKDTSYVKTVTAMYRRALDSIIDASGGRLMRSSLGKTDLSFTPNLDSTFNRGFTDYFLHRRRPEEKMASHDSPKSVGEEIGRVKKSYGNVVEVMTKKAISNGDGLTYYDCAGKLCGFRVNRVDGTRLTLSAPCDIPSGTKLYRNFDIKYDAAMRRDTATRTIDVTVGLRAAGSSGIAMDITLADAPGVSASTFTACDLMPARAPQEEARLRALNKFGDTVYRPVNITDGVGEQFVPLSVISKLRRDAVEALDRARRAAYAYDYRRPADPAATPFADHLAYNDNVANRLSNEFYKELGVKSIQPAMEVTGKPVPGTRVMLTRYCLRRELGACLRTPEGKKLKGPLTLRGANFKLGLEFDCSNCEMSVHLSANPK